MITNDMTYSTSGTPTSGTTYLADPDATATNEGTTTTVATDSYDTSMDSGLTQADAETFVTGLYETYLGREPDASGLDWWVQELLSGAATPTEVETDIANSAEAYQYAHRFDDDITGLYETELGRSPDDADLTYWSGRMSDGATYDQVQSEIHNSDEAIAYRASLAPPPSSDSTGTTSTYAASSNVELLSSGTQATLSGANAGFATASVMSYQPDPTSPSPGNGWKWMPYGWQEYLGSVWSDEVYDPSTGEMVGGYIADYAQNPPGWYDAYYFAQSAQRQAADASMYEGTSDYLVIGDYSSNLNPIFLQQLSRLPTSDELYFWDSAIESGYYNFTDISNYLAGTKLSATDTDYVSELFELYLGRSSDQAELDYWTNLLATGSATRASVANDIAASQEAVDYQTNTYQNSAVAVADIYLSEWGISPDADAEAWTDIIASGSRTEADVRNYFRNSAQGAAHQTFISQHHLFFQDLPTDSRGRTLVYLVNNVTNEAISLGYEGDFNMRPFYGCAETYPESQTQFDVIDDDPNSLWIPTDASGQPSTTENDLRNKIETMLAQGASPEAVATLTSGNPYFDEVAPEYFSFAEASGEDTWAAQYAASQPPTGSGTSGGTTSVTEITPSDNQVLSGNPDPRGWFESNIDTVNKTITSYFHVNMITDGLPNDQATKLISLAAEGLSTYWSRTIVLNGETYSVNVNLLQDPNGQPIPLAVNSDPTYARSVNTNGVNWLSKLVADGVTGGPKVYYQGSFFQSTSDADADFEETFAHEMGHPVLSIAADSTYSWTHKGTTTMSGSDSNTIPNIPTTGEIDLMQYYAQKQFVRSNLDRTSASESDVKNLIYISTRH